MSHECPWPNCGYEGRKENHLQQHLDSKHGGNRPRKEKLSEDEEEDPLTTALAFLVTGLAVLFGTWQRMGFGTVGMLQKFDPYEHFYLTQHWLNEGSYMVRDKLLFPLKNGQHPKVGYPPLTHFEPAAVTKTLQTLGVNTELVEVVSIMPVVLMGLTTVAMYFLGKELYNAKTGAIAAVLTATVPTYVMVGIAGAYDTNLHLFLFTTATLASVAKSLNQATKQERLYWGAVTGVLLGLFALHWRGYIYVAAFLGIAVTMYSFIGTAVNRLNPETTWSLAGLFLAIPVMMYWYVPTGNTKDLFAIAAVASTGLLPLILHSLPDVLKERFGVMNPELHLRNVSALLAVIMVATVWYAVNTGQLPFGFKVPGLGMLNTEGSYLTTISELQSAFETGDPLRRNFGILGKLVLPVAGGPVLFSMYTTWRDDFHPKRIVELTFLLLTFLMLFEASRFVEPYIVVMTPVLAAMASEALDIAGIHEVAQDPEPKRFIAVVAVAVLITALAVQPAPAVKTGGEMHPQSPTIYGESNGAWIDTYRHMAKDPGFNETTAVMSWWDYGFPAKPVAGVQYVSDNTQVNIDIPARFYATQNLSKGRQYLREELRSQRGEDVEYVVANKYLWYSGKWHAVVTVASTETGLGTPNLFDSHREPGETGWRVGGASAERSNYYRLSFYNSSLRQGDEPYPGYEIVYQSPQWFVETPNGLRIMDRSRLSNISVPQEAVKGPAITVYKVKD